MFEVKGVLLKLKKNTRSILSILSILSLVVVIGGVATAVGATAEKDAKAGDAKGDDFSTAQVQKIEKITHDYIVKHPQVIVEAVQALQQQAQVEGKKREGEMQAEMPKHTQEIFANKAQWKPTIGSENPKVVIAMFVSYQCPRCRSAELVVEKMLQERNDVQVMFVYWPFEGNEDIYAASMALASQKQGKFYEFHRALMRVTGFLSQGLIDKAAQEVKLDLAKLQHDAKDAAIETELKDNFKLAQDLKLIGTPTLFVANNKFTKVHLIPGLPTETELARAIDEVR